MMVSSGHGRLALFFALALTLVSPVRGQERPRAWLGAPVEVQAPPGVDERRTERLETDNVEMAKLLEQLAQKNRELRQQINALPTQAGSPPASRDEVRELVADYLSQSDRQPYTSDGVFRIGSSLGMTANWVHGVTFSTPSSDFTMHLGGDVQYDNVWWTQTSSLKTAKGANAGPAQGVLSGASLGGINDLQDGTYFRRIRLQTDGEIWETYEYILSVAYENDQYSSAGLNEFWVGAKDIPWLGTLRIGHVRAAHGLEADMTAASRVGSFMERSSYSEAIEGNNNFVTGLWLGNNYFDQRATWSATLGRADLGQSSGLAFGDGQYIALGRLTALPIYQNDGRELLHLGLAGGYAKAQTTTGGFATIELRARPELRDDDPAGSPSGVPAVPNADSNRMVDTGVLACDGQWELGTEFLYIRGPLSIQAEYGWTWLENVQGAVVNNALIKTVGGSQGYTFNGGYVQVCYTLTGENRAYETRLGRLDTNYFGAEGPFTKAWFVRDENGRLNWGLGAWELCARYSYVNLNDGVGANRIQGGIMDGITLGVNWHLMNSLRFTVDYVFNRRWDLPAGSIPGSTNGLGIRAQVAW
jgi:phosphate-selective porin OprO/OprP